MLSTRDLETVENDGWTNLILEMRKVKEFAMREGDISYQVISSELYIGNHDGLYFVDFGGSIEQPKNAAEFRQSPFYCASAEVLWQTQIYTE
jgi:hypothetical protein